MNFHELFTFLEDLNHEDHNHKAWMDEHRSRYENIRDTYIAFLEEVSLELGAMHPDYHPTTGKQSINRINNNKVFHPNRPTYKDHFGAGLDKAKNYADFYIHLGVNECFVAGGFFHAPSEILSKIRAAIDYNGDEFKAILNKSDFKNYYSSPITEDALKTSPKGYSKEHPHIDLLRLKSFAVMHPLSRKLVTAAGFKEELIKAYKLLLPFRNYLNQAVGFAED
jgi:uncharacterized protein (TIGR02453 family)